MFLSMFLLLILRQEKCVSYNIKNLHLTHNNLAKKKRETQMELSTRGDHTITLAGKGVA